MTKRNFAFLITLSAFSLILLAAGSRPGGTSPEKEVLRYVSVQLDTLQARIARLASIVPSADAASVRRGFADCRSAYKRLEAFAEYQYPAAAQRINGAALPEAEPSEPEEPMHPAGFQVIEEILFAEDSLGAEARLSAVSELGTMAHDIRRLQNYLTEDEALSSPQIFEALKLNLYRLVAKGISGFDSPVLLASVDEAVETLIGLEDVLRLYRAPDSVMVRIDAAVAALKGQDFDTFDRAAFLTGRLLPLMEAMHGFQRHLQIPFSRDARAVRAEAAHFFEEDAFDRYYFAPGGTGASSPGMVALGRALFGEPGLSATRNRSCASCHDPAKAFTDGLPVNMSLSGDEQLLRNTPTLLNAALQPAQFADSRSAFLEDQVHEVVSNKQEMGGDFAGILAQLRKKPAYRRLFEAAYPGHENSWQASHIKKALAAYVRSLVAMDSRFDRYMRGDKRAMNREELHGFNLFMGKAKCGTCHFAPLFSGAVPPLYDKMESEVLGVPSNTDTLRPVLDADPGKYGLYRMPHQLRSFKTPGLRNVSLTAPYMHNGIYRTLEEVMVFYERGGGTGLKLHVPNQTLPGDRLHLSDTEQRAVIAFLKALTDTAVVRTY